VDYMGHMSRDAIEGVLAHEISHIANGDMVRMTLIQGVVNAFVMFFSRIAAFMAGQAVKEEMQHVVHFIVYILCEIIFGLLSMLLVNWFSRQREFKADAGAAGLSSRDKMIAGLKSLQSFYSRNEIENEQPAFASLKIAGKSGGLMALFATHPPLEARIAALEALQR